MEGQKLAAQGPGGMGPRVQVGWGAGWGGETGRRTRSQSSLRSTPAGGARGRRPGRPRRLSALPSPATLAQQEVEETEEVPAEKEAASSDQPSFWFLYRSMSPRFKCAKNSKFKYQKGTVHLKTFVKRSEKFLLNRSD